MQQANTAKTRRLSRATSAHSGDERARDDRTRYGSCRDDRRHYGSCQRVRRPDALRKLSARETIALFGYRYNQLPGLIEQTPQWLPGPSPLLPVTAGPLADYQTGFKFCSTRCNFYSTIGMG